MADKLKDRFFQQAFFDALTKRLKRLSPGFDERRFFRLLHDEDWEKRELKQRMRHASEVLGQTLPREYRKALGILMRVEKHFEGFDHLLFADFVERFGVEDYQASIPALERLTRTSAEFAIRPFIKRYPKKTLTQMRRWAGSGDQHLRRLASEGSRARLPWGGALEELQKDPAPVLPILERLKDDPSEYVRRSVANNLNDISKDHPELILEIAGRWLEESRERQPLLKHALRGLLRKGDARAMEIFGLEVGARVKLAALAVEPRRIQIGGVGSLNLELVAGSGPAQLVRLEYIITYARPHGREAQKVFKIKETRLEPGKRTRITRKLDFSDRSTRKHYPGDHSLTLAINGVRVKSVQFSLTCRGRGTRPRAPRR